MEKHVYNSKLTKRSLIIILGWIAITYWISFLVVARGIGAPTIMAEPSGEYAGFGLRPGDTPKSVYYYYSKNQRLDEALSIFYKPIEIAVGSSCMYGKLNEEGLKYIPYRLFWKIIRYGWLGYTIFIVTLLIPVALLCLSVREFIIRRKNRRDSNVA